MAQKHPGRIAWGSGNKTDSIIHTSTFRILLDHKYTGGFLFCPSDGVRQFLPMRNAIVFLGFPENPLNFSLLSVMIVSKEWIVVTDQDFMSLAGIAGIDSSDITFRIFTSDY